MDELDELIASALSNEDDALLRDSEGPEHVFSAGYNERMALLFKQAVAPKTSNKRMHFKRRFVAAFATVVILTGMLTAGAFWDEISRFFIQVHDRYSSFDSNLSEGTSLVEEELVEDNIPDDWVGYWCPKLMLEGYEFKAAYTVQKVKYIVYKNNDEQEVVFKQQPNAAAVDSDNEGTIVPNIYIGKSEAFVLQKSIDGSDIYDVMWKPDGYKFFVTAETDLDNIITIAESIVFLEE